MLLATVLLAAQVQAPIYAVPSRIVDRDVAVPMRDSVVLRADVHRPPEGGPFPTLVYRTPYGKQDVETDYTTIRSAVERGYAVVVQDVRGRYKSDGTFEAYRQEGHDGYDTIEWAATQSWSNGRVGMFGLSYPGAVQWLAAMESPPHLLAMAPAMTFASPRQFFYSGGAFDLSWAGWIWNNIAPDARVRGNLPGPRTEREARATWRRERERVTEFRPLLDLPDFRAVAPWYYDWLRHEPTDPWWDWAELAGRYGKTRAAVLNLSGWHDEAYGPHGATKNFSGLVDARRSDADPRTWLIIGPWTHGVEATASVSSGRRFFGPSSAIQYDSVVLGFLDRHLKPGADSLAPPPRVQVFLMGANEWIGADRWPIPETRRESFWFGYDGRLTRTRPSVILGDETSSEFETDPYYPMRDPYEGEYGAHDYRELLRYDDLLTFETEPFKEPMDVVGSITAELYLETLAPDVDVYVKLLDVSPEGTAYNLMSPGLELLRASYREPAQGRQLLEKGRVYRLQLNDLMTGNRFKKGHRLRVHIMAAFLPHFSLNPQNGDSERQTNVTSSARIRIHHSLSRPSRLILPVLPAAPVKPE